MLCSLDIKILKYVKKKERVIWGVEKHPFALSDFKRLESLGYLSCQDYAIAQNPGEIPCPRSLFSITSYGMSALSEALRAKAIGLITLAASLISAAIALISELRGL